MALGARARAQARQAFANSAFAASRVAANPKLDHHHGPRHKSNAATAMDSTPTARMT